MRGRLGERASGRLSYGVKRQGGCSAAEYFSVKKITINHIYHIE
jgi:hypothetical protein